MNNNRRHVTLIWGFTGIFVASVAFLMACFYARDLSATAIIPLCLLSLPLIPLSYIAIVAVLVQGVRTHRVRKMEAWWWSSAPYAWVLPFSLLLFAAGKNTDNEMIALFALPAYVATLSSIGWILTTIYRATISKKAPLNPTNLAMIGVVLLACASWAALSTR